MSFFPAVMDDVYLPQHEIVGRTASNMLSLASLLEDGENDWDLSYLGGIRTEIEEKPLETCLDSRCDCLVVIRA